MSTLRESLALPAGAMVGDYRLERVRTTWGFFLVYDAIHATSGEAVAVHELVPEELVTRAKGGSLVGRSREDEEKLAWAAERFLREGATLGECVHPALQKVSAFEANGTSYWVTRREETHTFKTWLQQLGHPPTEANLRRMLGPVLAGLQQAHGAGLFHLNLKPETIQLDDQDRPVLVHFSGARQAIARHGYLAGAVTTGYSPPEQYDVEKAGDPLADIYSLAAVLYRAISGHAPPEADQRAGSSDPYQPLAGRYSASYRLAFLAAIDAALAVDPRDRPQSIEEWRSQLGFGATPGGRRSPSLIIAGAAAAILILGVGVWFLFPRPPVPDDRGKDSDKFAQNDVSSEDQKTQEEKARTEAEQKSAEEQRKREEAQKANAESKPDAQKMAANEDAAAKAEAEKLAAERLAQLAQEAAEAAAQAEAAQKAAEEAARTAAADPTKKAAAEKAAAAAAEEAARKKADAEKAAGLAAMAQQNQEKAEQARMAAEQNMAKRQVMDEAAKRQEAAVAAQKAAAGAEKRAEVQSMPADKAAAERMAVEKAMAEKMAEERAAAQQAAMERAAVEKAAAEQAAARAAAEKMAAAEQAAARAAAEKMAAEKAAAEKAAAEKMAANQQRDPNQGKYKQTGVEGVTEENNDGKKTGTGERGSSAISGIPGVWETTATDPDGKPKRRLTIYDDGRYLISDNQQWKDAGIILASAGRIQMRSDATGQIIRSSFKLRSLSKIVTSGGLGEEEWKRVSRSPGNDPARPKP